MAGGAATAALVELDPEGDKRHAALLATLAQTVGGAAGPLLTGMLAEWLPAPRVLCYVVGMLACGAAAALLLAMPEPGQPARRRLEPAAAERAAGRSAPPSRAWPSPAPRCGRWWRSSSRSCRRSRPSGSGRTTSRCWARSARSSSSARAISQVASRDSIEPRIAQALGLAPPDRGPCGARPGVGDRQRARR